MGNDIKTIIEEIKKKPDSFSPLEHEEWYDGWNEAIKYVVSILEKYNDLVE